MGSKKEKEVKTTLLYPDLVSQRAELTEMVKGFNLIDDLSRITNLKVLYSEIEPGGYFQPHKDKYSHIFFVTEGSLLFEANDNEIEVSAGGVLNVESGFKHSYKNNSSKTAKLITMNVHRT